MTSPLDKQTSLVGIQYSQVIEPGAATKETIIWNNHRPYMRKADVAPSPDGDREETFIMSMQQCPHCHYIRVPCGLTAVLILGPSDNLMDAATVRSDILALGSLFGSKGKHKYQRWGRFGSIFKESTCPVPDVQLSCAPLPRCTNCWYRRSRSFCDTSVKVWSNDSWWHFLTRWSVSKMWGDVSVNCVLQTEKKKENQRLHKRNQPPSVTHWNSNTQVWFCALCVILLFLSFKFWVEKKIILSLQADKILKRLSPFLKPLFGLLLLYS